MRHRNARLAIIFSLLFSSHAFALPAIQSAFVAKYPAVAKTKLDSCTTCHSPLVDGFVNAYGAALKNAHLDFGAVEKLPSVVAGKTNLEQINGLAFPGSWVTDPDVFEFPNENGTVRFNHSAHITQSQYKISGKCDACHGSDAKRFSKVYDPTVVVMAKAHATCLGCHKTMNTPAAPVKCGDCHAQ